MSILQFTFESECLNNNTQISVILPDKPRALTPEAFYGNGRKYKVLWLLHGTFGDHTDWVRKTNIEMYAVERNLVVVMPSALNSNYSNWENTMLGFNMFDFLTEELMPLIYGWFRYLISGRITSSPGSAWAGAARSNMRSTIPRDSRPRLSYLRPRWICPRWGRIMNARCSIRTTKECGTP